MLTFLSFARDNALEYPEQLPSHLSEIFSSFPCSEDNRAGISIIFCHYLPYLMHGLQKMKANFKETISNSSCL